jgi:glycosyltransferase involved in cell wall biosynthesis
VPYQRLLAEALERLGVRVSFLRDYRRGLPLWRLMRAWRRQHACDLLHLHWPEAYYPKKGDGLDWFRFARFPLDLWLATRGGPLAVTAHNLHAHNRRDLFAFRNTRAAFQRAQVVFAHSEVAKALLQKTYGLAARKVCVIPHGDLSVVLDPPLPRDTARRELGLGDGKLCLIFGAIEPYKGIEEVIAFWKTARPECQLAIVGKPCDEPYGASIARLAAEAPGVRLHLGWKSDANLRQWLSAADCALFNYRTVFTSGAASLARSYGIPQLLPARLETVVLDEPTPFVRRFRSIAEDFPARLAETLAVKPEYEAAAPWRAATSWARVAELTLQAYRDAAGQASPAKPETQG